MMRGSGLVGLPLRAALARSVRSAQIGANVSRCWLSTEAEKFSFKAETASLLNIVSNSLYTEKEVFVRELLSNASDALEKARQLEVAGGVLAGPETPLQIRITLDKAAKTLTIEDGGIGMTREELSTNLGTIALSGSKRYAAAMEDKGGDASGIIGQFGVGFYSAFMVSKRVIVESKPANGEPWTRWVSEDGVGNYTLETVDKVEEAPPTDQAIIVEGKELPKTDPVFGRGSKVVCELKDGCEEYMDVAKLRAIIKKYSNFVAFPIFVEGTQVNVVEAIWTRDPKEVAKKDYEEFYRFTFKDAFDKPSFTTHFRADAPLEIKALLFFPSFHSEKMGQGRIEPSLQLYSRKVLIESPCVELAPDWMRFVKGVVDSEDIPLSISREKSQDRRILAKLQDIVVRKTLRFLLDMSKNKRQKYLEWYDEFDVFLKEGACHDAARTADISKLLYFDSSRCVHGKSEKTSLDEYVGRLGPEDDDTIYYLYAPSRELAEASPYFEAFKREKRECLFVYNAIDDFVMSNIKEFNGRKIKTAETADLKGAKKEEEKKEDDAEKKDEEKKEEKKEKKYDQVEENAKVLSAWLTRTLDERLASCAPTTRLVDSPAVVTDAESGAMRRMMSMVSQQSTGDELPPLAKQKLLINPNHSIVKNMYSLAIRARDDPTDENAKVLAEATAHQLLDNALVAAGLIDDPRSMLPRLSHLLDIVLKNGPGPKDHIKLPEPPVEEKPAASS